MKISNQYFYLPADFIKLPKYDAHMHYHTFSDLFVRKAKKNNIQLITINTSLDSPLLNTQFEIAQFHHLHHPKTFDFIGTFDAAQFSLKTFAEDTIKQIKKCMAAGSRGVKIWKNIGMALKKEDGQYIMIDDPVFAPIFEFLEKEKIPLLTHLGEPRNCWLPLEQMTISSARKYFSKNPNYHAYLHPEIPSYEQQIMARDNILERYPGLIFIGAHLGSMEWNLEEVAKRLDRFSNFYVDLSGRFNYIFEQTIHNRTLVTDFFEKYHNRILYGSDCFFSKYDGWKGMNFFCKYFPHVYMNLLYKKQYFRLIKSQWLFLATDKVIKTGKISNKPDFPKYVKGLKLSKNIVDRIFYENARCVYFNPIIKS